MKSTLKMPVFTMVSKTKYTLMLAIVILFFTQIADAQQTNGLSNKTPEQRAAAQTSVMKDALDLNAGQTTKIQAINLKYAQKFEPIIKSDDSKISRFRQAKALMNAKDAELKTALTDSQYKQYEELKAEMQEKLKDKMSNN